MPAQKIPLLTLSVAAAAAHPEFLAVTAAGALPGAGAKILGITTELAVSGKQVPIDVLGTTVATAGAAVALDAELEATAAGKLITATTGVVVARALQAAAADGDKFEVLLTP